MRSSTQPHWGAAACIGAALLVLATAASANLPSAAWREAAEPLPGATAASGPAGGTGRWYERFHDATLSALARAAARHAAAPAEGTQAEMDTATAYVLARATAVRLALLAEMRATLLRQREFIGGSAPLRSSAAGLAQLDDLLLESQQQAAAMQALLGDAVARLASLCAASPDAMRAWLGDTAKTPQLLVFDTRQLDKPDAGLGAGRHEGDLQALRRLADVADQADQRLRQREKEFQAVELRNKRGGASELEVIGAYRRLLAGNEQLALTTANLALGWIGLVRKLGGEAFSAEVGPAAKPVSLQRP